MILFGSVFLCSVKNMIVKDIFINNGVRLNFVLSDYDVLGVCVLSCDVFRGVIRD